MGSLRAHVAALVLVGELRLNRGNGRDSARPYRQSRSRSMPSDFRAASPFAARVNHLRVRGGPEHSRVTTIELFYDLVFVFAVTQLSHGLLEHLTPLGALQTAVLLLA